MADESPWADLKETNKSMRETFNNFDKFARASTSTTIGPLATRALNATKGWLAGLFTPKPQAPTNPQAQKPGILRSILGRIFSSTVPQAPSVDYPDASPDVSQGDDSDWSAPEVSAPDVSAGDLGDWT